MTSGQTEIMLPASLNHMTAPTLSASKLLTLAGELGCAGVEFRNDLGRPLFDGLAAEDVADQAKANGLRIFALAEVKAFNDPAGDAVGQAERLVKTANACDAEGVALIPKVAKTPVPRADQRAALMNSLASLQPVFDSSGQVGLIEPLGFENSSLRFKDDVTAVLDEMGQPECFRLVHDTFHHHLAETDSIHTEMTALVHISGVEAQGLSAGDFTDAHRILVGQGDLLGNIAQLKKLEQDGYDGPISIEAFAPEIHEMTDPAKALAGSINFIADQLAGEPV